MVTHSESQFPVLSDIYILRCKSQSCDIKDKKQQQQQKNKQPTQFKEGHQVNIKSPDDELIKL